MTILIYTILAIFIGYLFLTSGYQFLLALASKFYKKRDFVACSEGKLCIIVPTYKGDATILSSAKYNLNVLQNSKSADLLVVADGLRKETVTSLKEMGANVLEVEFEKSTKVKSLQKAAESLKAEKYYDQVLILDADNLLHARAEEVVAHYSSKGFVAIQGERLPMNQETTMALLDGLSEKANQEMLCKGANILGFSSKLTGSAMAFDFDLFCEIIEKSTAVGGFDKEMELMLTERGIFIKYAPELMVLDEKVRASHDFEKQRGRWLESQYSFLAKSFQPALKMALRGNFDYLHKSLQLALPPRVLAPAIWVLLIGLSFAFAPAAFGWIAMIGLTLLLGSYFLVIPFHWWSGKLPAILGFLPSLFIAGVRSLFWMKKSKKQFLHTNHQPVHS